MPGGEGIGAETAEGSRLAVKVTIEAEVIEGGGGGLMAKLDIKAEAEGAGVRAEG